MKIIIETIPHDQQRYPTVGDWYYEEDGTLRVKVSELGNPVWNTLVYLHELVEVELCKHAAVSQHDVDNFDMKFEEDRKAGLHSPEDEPGDDIAAPYRKQHCFATAVERMMAAEMNVAWNDYAAKVESLP